MPGPYKIGEAAALLNLKTYVLRFWETEFPQIVPSRTETGRRVYTEENLALLDRIRFLLYEHGLTIEGARRVLNEEAAKGMRYAPPSIPEQIEAESDGDEVEVAVSSTTPLEPAPRNALDVVAPATPMKPAPRNALEIVVPTAPLRPVPRNTLDDVLHSGDGDGLSASDKGFLCELRAELEKVKAILAGSAPQGDSPA